MKSRVSIFTLRGRSRRDLSCSAVTMGYVSYSSRLSGGNTSSLCCHPWSFAASSLPPFCMRDGRYVRRWQRTRGAILCKGVCRSLEHVSWESKRRMRRLRATESIGNTGPQSMACFTRCPDSTCRRCLVVDAGEARWKASSAISTAVRIFHTVSDFYHGVR